MYSCLATFDLPGLAVVTPILAIFPAVADDFGLFVTLLTSIIFGHDASGGAIDTPPSDHVPLDAFGLYLIRDESRYGWDFLVLGWWLFAGTCVSRGLGFDLDLVYLSETAYS